MSDERDTRDVERLLAPLRGSVAPPTGEIEARRREDAFIASVMAAETPANAAEPANRRRWVAFAAAALVLVVGGAALTWWWAQRSPAEPEKTARKPTAPSTMGSPNDVPAPPRIATAAELRVDSRRGTVEPAQGETLPPGSAIETRGPDSRATLLGAGRSLSLRLGPRSRLTRAAGVDWHLHVRGQLYVEVHGRAQARRLEVRTDRGRIAVTGTKFLVSAGQGKTVIRVLEGSVRYWPLGGPGPVDVATGSELTHDDTGLRVAAAPDALPGWVVSRPPSRGMTAIGSAKPCSLSRVRRLLRGRAHAARAEIRRCRKAGVAGKRARSLDVYDAQALLALGRVAAAAKAYHRIARRHRGSRAAQNALFTAGQLEMTRLGRRARALRTFRVYLRQYPGGRYASEARSLVKSLAPR